MDLCKTVLHKYVLQIFDTNCFKHNNAPQMRMQIAKIKALIISISGIHGSELESAVASELGAAVGSELGCAVGSVLGSAVGSVLGSVVGSVLGSVVGLSVGLMVGSEVGKHKVRSLLIEPRNSPKCKSLIIKTQHSDHHTKNHKHTIDTEYVPSAVSRNKSS